MLDRRSALTALALSTPLPFASATRTPEPGPDPGQGRILSCSLLGLLRETIRESGHRLFENKELEDQIFDGQIVAVFVTGPANDPDARVFVVFKNGSTPDVREVSDGDHTLLWEFSRRPAVAITEAASEGRLPRPREVEALPGRERSLARHLLGFLLARSLVTPNGALELVATYRENVLRQARTTLAQRAERGGWPAVPFFRVGGEDLPATAVLFYPKEPREPLEAGGTRWLASWAGPSLLLAPAPDQGELSERWTSLEVGDVLDEPSLEGAGFFVRAASLLQVLEPPV